MFSHLLELRLELLRSSAHPKVTPALTLLTKHLISIGKLYRLLLSHNPTAFSQMGISTSVIETYWHALQNASSHVAAISDDVVALFPERLVVQTLLLLQTLLGDWSSAGPVEVSSDFVGQFSSLIVTHFLPLRQVDLEKWAEDPEEWMNEEEAERWEYELRVSNCARGFPPPRS